MNFPNIDMNAVLYLASYADYKTLVLLSLRNGANINAEGEFYGTALQAASANGHGEIARLLVENGAIVNAEGGYYGTALRVASANGDGEIARLLLENGANVNAEGGSYGAALQAASANGHGEIARLLLENGANVNAEGAPLGNSLEAAVESFRATKEIVQLLLDKGAIVTDKTMELASVSRGKGVKKLIRDASKSQSSSVRDPTSSAGEPSRSLA
ncbi:hypothetical protein MMC22_010627 [Lobaria immixta]|nr:hypothetical protein [Lobaria immixta]